MTPEIQQLQAQIVELSARLNKMERSDHYEFQKDVSFKGAKIGFFGALPVTRPSSTGTTLNMTTVGGATVNESNGFAGSTGTTFYTIGDIVKHLKALGLLTK